MNATIYNDTDKKLMTAQQRYYRALGALIVTVVLALVASLAVLYYQNEKLTSLANTNKAATAILVECTTPPELRHPPVVISAKNTGKDCYTRTRAETGRAVQSIRTISIAAAACGAAHPGDVKATEACVNDTLSNR